MRLRAFSFSALRGGRWFVSQVAVAVVATLCVAALFPSAKAPPAPAPVMADGSKSAQRVGNGAVDQTVLRYGPQEQAALASFASFTPHAVAASSPVTVVAARTAAAKAPSVVMPPRRPTFAAAAPAEVANATVPVAGAGSAQRVVNWKVAGVGIPGSGTLRRYVPSGSDIVATGNSAWSATTSATKTVARKVVDLGGMLGL